MFDADDQQFLKFHGIYQQDDRDVRKQGKKYMFMIRGRIRAAGSRRCTDLRSLERGVRQPHLAGDHAAKFSFTAW